ncbi:hypothetical protein Nmel_002633 [Mimus melanotis]
MQPVGEEEGAGGVVLQPSADPQLPPSASGSLMVFYELGTSGEIEVVEEEAEAAGGESTASLEELEEEEAVAPGGCERRGGGGRRVQELHVRGLQRDHHAGGEAAQALDVQAAPQQDLQGQVQAQEERPGPGGRRGGGRGGRPAGRGYC